jgi:hypothetical protein
MPSFHRSIQSSQTTTFRWFTCLMALLLGFPAAADTSEPAAPLHNRLKPTMAEFIGLNVHTVQFKPDLYAPVCKRLRDYHPLRWDFNNDLSKLTTFPMTTNGVDWQQLYGSWTKAGFDIDACILFDDVPPEQWKDKAADARSYGEAFARYFGPSGEHKLTSAMEIGNEPAKYDDAQYRVLFEAMARGVRAGDPKLKIATCAVMTEKTDAWSKPLSAIAGLEQWYDVLNIHSYPFKNKWPTWRRSYPEDASIPYLKAIEDLSQWRDTHAPAKELWLTEFGYDSATSPPAADGPWKQWVGVNDLEQARYIVRSFLVLSSMNVDRAYLYFFNDKDEAQLHGASGITRNFQPKPSYYAVSYLNKSLGEYRFNRAISRKDGELYCFEYQHRDHPRDRIFVAWLASGEDQSKQYTLPLGAASAGIYRAERMPASIAAAAGVPWKTVADGIEVQIGAVPVFLWSH